MTSKTTTRKLIAKKEKTMTMRVRPAVSLIEYDVTRSVRPM